MNIRTGYAIFLMFFISSSVGFTYYTIGNYLPIFHISVFMKNIYLLLSFALSSGVFGLMLLNYIKFMKGGNLKNGRSNNKLAR